MSSSPSPAADAVLRGADADGVGTVRLDADLRRVGPLPYPHLREELEAARRSAHAVGYAAGWAEGHRAATAQVRAESESVVQEATANLRRESDALARALAALDRAAGELERRALPVLESASAELAAAAVLLAEALLGRELQLREDGSLDAVRRALALAPHGRPLVVRLHPDEYAIVRVALETAPPAEAAGRPLELVADPSVERGGCVVDCDATRIDAQLGPALARVREVLET